MEKLIYYIDAQVVFARSFQSFYRMLRTNASTNMPLRCGWGSQKLSLPLSLLVGFNVQPRLTLCCVLRMFYIFHCLHGVSHSMSPCYAHLFVSIVFVTAYFVIHMYSAVCSSCAGVPLRTICKQCLHTRDARDFPETNNKWRWARNTEFRFRSDQNQRWDVCDAFHIRKPVRLC